MAGKHVEHLHRITVDNKPAVDSLTEVSDILDIILDKLVNLDETGLGQFTDAAGVIGIQALRSAELAHEGFESLVESGQMQMEERLKFLRGQLTSEAERVARAIKDSMEAGSGAGGGSERADQINRQIDQIRSKTESLPTLGENVDPKRVEQVKRQVEQMGISLEDAEEGMAGVAQQGEKAAQVTSDLAEETKEAGEASSRKAEEDAKSAQAAERAEEAAKSSKKAASEKARAEREAEEAVEEAADQQERNRVKAAEVKKEIEEVEKRTERAAQAMDFSDEIERSENELNDLLKEQEELIDGSTKLQGEYDEVRTRLETIVSKLGERAEYTPFGDEMLERATDLLEIVTALVDRQKEAKEAGEDGLKAPVKEPYSEIQDMRHGLEIIRDSFGNIQSLLTELSEGDEFGEIGNRFTKHAGALVGLPQLIEKYIEQTSLWSHAMGEVSVSSEEVLGRALSIKDPLEEALAVLTRFREGEASVEEVKEAFSDFGSRVDTAKEPLAELQGILTSYDPDAIPVKDLREALSGVEGAATPVNKKLRETLTTLQEYGQRQASVEEVEEAFNSLRGVVSSVEAESEEAKEPIDNILSILKKYSDGEASVQDVEDGLKGVQNVSKEVSANIRDTLVVLQRYRTGKRSTEEVQESLSSLLETVNQTETPLNKAQAAMAKFAEGEAPIDEVRDSLVQLQGLSSKLDEPLQDTLNTILRYTEGKATVEDVREAFKGFKESVAPVTDELGRLENLADPITHTSTEVKELSENMRRSIDLIRQLHPAMGDADSDLSAMLGMEDADKLLKAANNLLPVLDHFDGWMTSLTSRGQNAAKYFGDWRKRLGEASQTIVDLTQVREGKIMPETITKRVRALDDALLDVQKRLRHMEGKEYIPARLTTGPFSGYETEGKKPQYFPYKKDIEEPAVEARKAVYGLIQVVDELGKTRAEHVVDDMEALKRVVTQGTSDSTLHDSVNQIVTLVQTKGRSAIPTVRDEVLKLREELQRKGNVHLVNQIDQIIESANKGDRPIEEFKQELDDLRKEMRKVASHESGMVKTLDTIRRYMDPGKIETQDDYFRYLGQMKSDLRDVRKEALANAEVDYSPMADGIEEVVVKLNTLVGIQETLYSEPGADKMLYAERGRELASSLVEVRDRYGDFIDAVDRAKAAHVGLHEQVDAVAEAEKELEKFYKKGDYMNDREEEARLTNQLESRVEGLSSAYEEYGQAQAALQGRQIAMNKAFETTGTLFQRQIEAYRLADPQNVLGKEQEVDRLTQAYKNYMAVQATIVHRAGQIVDYTGTHEERAGNLEVALNRLGGAIKAVDWDEAKSALVLDERAISSVDKGLGVLESRLQVLGDVYNRLKGEKVLGDSILPMPPSDLTDLLSQLGTVEDRILVVREALESFVEVDAPSRLGHRLQSAMDDVGNRIGVLDNTVDQYTKSWEEARHAAEEALSEVTKSITANRAKDILTQAGYKEPSEEHTLPRMMAHLEGGPTSAKGSREVRGIWDRIGAPTEQYLDKLEEAVALEKQVEEQSNELKNSLLNLAREMVKADLGKTGLKDYKEYALSIDAALSIVTTKAQEAGEAELRMTSEQEEAIQRLIKAREHLATIIERVSAEGTGAWEKEANIQAIDDAVSAVNAEMEKLAQAEEKVGSATQKMRAEYEEAEREAAELRSELQELKEMVARGEWDDEKVESFTQKLIKSRDRTEELRARHHALGEEAKRVSTAVEGQSDAIQSLADVSGKSAKEIRDLRGRNSEAAIAARDMKEEVDSLAGGSKALHSSLTSLPGVIDKLHKSLEGMQGIMTPFIDPEGAKKLLGLVDQVSTTLASAEQGAKNAGKGVGQQYSQGVSEGLDDAEKQFIVKLSDMDADFSWVRDGLVEAFRDACKDIKAAIEECIESGISFDSVRRQLVEALSKVGSLEIQADALNLVGQSGTATVSGGVETQTGGAGTRVPKVDPNDPRIRQIMQLTGKSASEIAGEVQAQMAQRGVTAGEPCEPPCPPYEPPTYEGVRRESTQRYDRRRQAARQEAPQVEMPPDVKRIYDELSREAPQDRLTQGFIKRMAEISKTGDEFKKYVTRAEEVTEADFEMARSAAETQKSLERMNEAFQAKDKTLSPEAYDEAVDKQNTFREAINHTSRAQDHLIQRLADTSGQDAGDVREWVTSYQDLEQKQAELGERSDELKEKLEQTDIADPEFEPLKQEYEEVQAEQQALMEQQEKLVARLAGFSGGEDELEDLLARQRAYSEEVSESEQELKTLRELLSGLPSNTIEELEGELAQARARVDELGEAFTHATDPDEQIALAQELTEARAHMQDLEQGLTQLRSQFYFDEGVQNVAALAQEVLRLERGVSNAETWMRVFRRQVESSAHPSANLFATLLQEQEDLLSLLPDLERHIDTLVSQDDIDEMRDLALAYAEVGRVGGPDALKSEGMQHMRRTIEAGLEDAGHFDLLVDLVVREDSINQMLKDNRQERMTISLDVDLPDDLRDMVRGYMDMEVLAEDRRAALGDKRAELSGLDNEITRVGDLVEAYEEATREVDRLSTEREAQMQALANMEEGDARDQAEAKLEGIEEKLGRATQKQQELTVAMGVYRSQIDAYTEARDNQDQVAESLKNIQDEQKNLKEEVEKPMRFGDTDELEESLENLRKEEKQLEDQLRAADLSSELKQAREEAAELRAQWEKLEGAKALSDRLADAEKKAEDLKEKIKEYARIERSASKERAELKEVLATIDRINRATRLLPSTLPTDYQKAIEEVQRLEEEIKKVGNVDVGALTAQKKELEEGAVLSDILSRAGAAKLEGKVVSKVLSRDEYSLVKQAFEDAEQDVINLNHRLEATSAILSSVKAGNMKAVGAAADELSSHLISIEEEYEQLDQNKFPNRARALRAEIDLLNEILGYLVKVEDEKITFDEEGVRNLEAEQALLEEQTQELDKQRLLIKSLTVREPLQGEKTSQNRVDEIKEMQAATEHWAQDALMAEEVIARIEEELEGATGDSSELSKELEQAREVVEGLEDQMEKVGFNPDLLQDLREAVDREKELQAFLEQARGAGKDRTYAKHELEATRKKISEIRAELNALKGIDPDLEEKMAAAIDRADVLEKRLKEYRDRGIEIPVDVMVTARSLQDIRKQISNTEATLEDVSIEGIEIDASNVEQARLQIENRLQTIYAHLDFGQDSEKVAGLISEFEQLRKKIEDAGDGEEVLPLQERLREVRSELAKYGGAETILNLEQEALHLEGLQPLVNQLNILQQEGEEAENTLRSYGAALSSGVLSPDQIEEIVRAQDEARDSADKARIAIVNIGQQLSSGNITADNVQDVIRSFITLESRGKDLEEELQKIEKELATSMTPDQLMRTMAILRETMQILSSQRKELKLGLDPKQIKKATDALGVMVARNPELMKQLQQLQSRYGNVNIRIGQSTRTMNQAQKAFWQYIATSRIGTQALRQFIAQNQGTTTSLNQVTSSAQQAAQAMQNVQQAGGGGVGGGRGGFFGRLFGGGGAGGGAGGLLGGIGGAAAGVALAGVVGVAVVGFRTLRNVIRNARMELRQWIRRAMHGLWRVGKESVKLSMDFETFRLSLGRMFQIPDQFLEGDNITSRLLGRVDTTAIADFAQTAVREMSERIGVGMEKVAFRIIPRVSSMEELERVGQLIRQLAASAPDLKWDDALRSINEALAGDTVSLRRSFELNTDLINRLQDEIGLTQGLIQGLSVELRKMGLDWETVSMSTEVLRDRMIQLYASMKAVVGVPVMEDLKRGLRDALNLINRNRERFEAILTKVGEGVTYLVDRVVGLMLRAGDASTLDGILSAFESFEKWIIRIHTNMEAYELFMRTAVNPMLGIFRETIDGVTKVLKGLGSGLAYVGLSAENATTALDFLVPGLREIGSLAKWNMRLFTDMSGALTDASIEMAGRFAWLGTFVRQMPEWIRTNITWEEALEKASVASAHARANAIREVVRMHQEEQEAVEKTTQEYKELTQAREEDRIALSKLTDAIMSANQAQDQLTDKEKERGDQIKEIAEDQKDAVESINDTIESFGEKWGIEIEVDFDEEQMTYVDEDGETQTVTIARELSYSIPGEDALDIDSEDLNPFDDLDAQILEDLYEPLGGVGDVLTQDVESSWNSMLNSVTGSISDMDDVLNEQLEADKNRLDKMAELRREWARERLEINQELLDDLEDMWDKYESDRAKAAQDLADDEVDAQIKEDRAIRDLQEETAKKRIENEKDLMRKLRDIRMQFAFDAEEAIRSNNVVAYLRARRKLLFDLRKAEQDSQDKDEDITQGERDRLAELEQQRQDDVADARLANERKLRDLRTALDEELDERRKAYDRSIRDQREAEDEARYNLRLEYLEDLADETENLADKAESWGDSFDEPLKKLQEIEEQLLELRKLEDEAFADIVTYFTTPVSETITPEELERERLLAEEFGLPFQTLEERQAIFDVRGDEFIKNLKNALEGAVPDEVALNLDDMDLAELLITARDYEVDLPTLGADVPPPLSGDMDQFIDLMRTVVENQGIDVGADATYITLARAIGEELGAKYIPQVWTPKLREAAIDFANEAVSQYGTQIDRESITEESLREAPDYVILSVLEKYRDQGAFIPPVGTAEYTADQVSAWGIEPVDTTLAQAEIDARKAIAEDHARWREERLEIAQADPTAGGLFSTPRSEEEIQGMSDLQLRNFVESITGRPDEEFDMSWTNEAYVDWRKETEGVLIEVWKRNHGMPQEIAEEWEKRLATYTDELLLAMLGQEGVPTEMEALDIPSYIEETVARYTLEELGFEPTEEEDGDVLPDPEVEDRVESLNYYKRERINLARDAVREVSGIESDARDDEEDEVEDHRRDVSSVNRAYYEWLKPFTNDQLGEVYDTLSEWLGKNEEEVEVTYEQFEDAIAEALEDAYYAEDSAWSAQNQMLLLQLRAREKIIATSVQNQQRLLGGMYPGVSGPGGGVDVAGDSSGNSGGGMRAWRRQVERLAMGYLINIYGPTDEWPQSPTAAPWVAYDRIKTMNNAALIEWILERDPDANIPDLPAFARGGRYPTGRTLLVGEEGPELVEFDKPGRILDSAETLRVLANANNSATAIPNSLLPEHNIQRMYTPESVMHIDNRQTFEIDLSLMDPTYLSPVQLGTIKTLIKETIADVQRRG